MILIPSTEQHEPLLRKKIFSGIKVGVFMWLILCSKCTKTHLRTFAALKIFLGSLSLAMMGRGEEGRGEEEREGKEGK